MTYNEIMQKAGKRVKKHVYYIRNGTTTNVNDDNVVQVTFNTQTPLIGLSITECEVILKEALPMDSKVYVQIEASYQINVATKTYGAFYIKEEPKYDASKRDYTHKTYNKILLSMVDYEPITMTYPCTVYEFFEELIDELGYTTQIASLPNGLRQMTQDIYDGINYTFRDVLEDILVANGILCYLDGNELKKAVLGANTITINDDILKNKSIDFGQHFGPINSIVLSRSADSDSVYLQDDESIEENGLCEFKISDNQLMNENDRSDYLPALLQQLDGIEYDIYDTELVGYGDLLPLQGVSFTTGNNTYSSYIFNHEEKHTSGFKQAIYNDMPEESVTDYKASSKTDKAINQVYIIARKQDGRIDEVVTQVNNTNSTLEEVRTSQTATERRIDVISTNIDANGNVTEVTTTTGFTFNADGMEISGGGFKAQHTSEGTYYKDGDAIVGQYTKNGSKQKDLELFGTYYYGKNNINDVAMFVGQLYTDEDGEIAFGHFLNKED